VFIQFCIRTSILKLSQTNHSSQSINLVESSMLAKADTPLKIAHGNKTDPISEKGTCALTLAMNKGAHTMCFKHKRFRPSKHSHVLKHTVCARPYLTVNKGRLSILMKFMTI